MADNLTPKEEFLLNPVEEHNITDAAVASFETNFKHPVKVTVPIAPVQEGSGDPSPENVRPISGWTGATVYNGRVNVLPPIDNGYYPIFLTKGTTVTASIAYTTQTLKRVLYYRKDKTLIDYCAVSVEYDNGNRLKKTFELKENAYYFAFANGLTDVQLEIGSIASPYVSPSMQIIPITFTDPSTGDPMTVYGGTVTLNEDGSADLVTSWGSTDLGSVNWKKASTSNSYYTPNNAIPYKKQGTTIGQIMCSCFKNDGGRYTTSWYGADGTFRYYSGSSATREIYIYDERYSSAEAFKAGVTGELFVYEINSPQTYHFSNVGQLKAFLGQNNIWSDIGNVNVKYLTQNSATGLEYRGDRALELRRRALIGDAPTIHMTIGSTATGGRASFKSYIKASVKKIEIPFYPKQEGTGDPSPDNVRPISGWTGCDITRTGKNLYDKNTITVTTQRTVNYMTGELNGLSNSRMGYTSYVPIQENTWYSISGIGYGAATNAGHAFYDKDKVYISGVSKGGSATSFETPAGVAFARFSVIAATGTSAATLADEIQLELGQTATDFEAYNANALSVDWTDDAGTVYGGTVTLNEDGSADLVEDWYHFTWDGVTNKATRIYGDSDESQQYVNFYSYISILEKNIVGSRWVQNTVICDTLSEGSTGNPEAYHGNVAINFCYIYIRKDVLSEVTVAGVNAYLQEHPVTFSGKALDGYFTPNVYHFSNLEQLKVWLGENNFWCDISDDITVKYWNRG